MKTGFGEHILAGLVSLVILILLGFGKLSMNVLIIASFVFIIGSVLPDLDSPFSKPRRIFRKVILAIMILLIFVFYDGIVSICNSTIKSYCAYSPLFAALTPLLVLVILDALIPRHRGFLHSFSAAVVYGVFVLLILINKPSLSDSLIISLFGAIGYTVHILVDFFGDRLPF
jgi:hypothetical protein